MIELANVGFSQKLLGAYRAVLEEATSRMRVNIATHRLEGLLGLKMELPYEPSLKAEPSYFLSREHEISARAAYETLILCALVEKQVMFAGDSGVLLDTFTWRIEHYATLFVRRARQCAHSQRKRVRSKFRAFARTEANELFGALDASIRAVDALLERPH